LKRIAHLEDLLSVLRESNCSPNAPLSERLEEAENLYKKYNIHLVCEALNISRSSFYNHIKRNKRERAWYFKRREELRREILDIFDETDQVYGARKMAAALRARNISVSVRLVRELMADMGLISIRVYSSYLYNKEFGKYKNYVNQDFSADRPNMIWVSDVTYFKYKEQPYYICVILDLFARKAIVCRIGRSNSTYLVSRTFRDAYNDRLPDKGLIFHSDRGANYTSESFRKLLVLKGVCQSFSKPGVPYDNAVMENFFGTLKKEELYRRKYRSERELKECVAAFIIRYNNDRRHEKLNYRTPNQVEAEYYSNSNDEQV
jgi:transposase InsO family protein